MLVNFSGLFIIFFFSKDLIFLQPHRQACEQRGKQGYPILNVSAIVLVRKMINAFFLFIFFFNLVWDWELLAECLLLILQPLSMGFFNKIMPGCTWHASHEKFFNIFQLLNRLPDPQI